MATDKRSTKEILKQNLARSAPGSIKEMIVMMHDVRSMHNVGAAFRCADVFGIKKLLLSGVSPTPPRPEISKTAIGAEKFVAWEKVSDPEAKINRLKTEGYRIIGIEQTQSSMLLPDYAPSSEKKCCLIFGNEVTGIDEAILPFIDDFVEIPQYGHKHSLNVSVAVGVVLYGFLQKFWV